MLRVGGWLLYLWQEGGRQTLIDTGAPGGAEEIAPLVPGLERIVLTHFHTDHTGNAEELRTRTGATVIAGAADAAVLRGLDPGAPAVLEDWERPIFERTSAGLPWTVTVTVDVTVTGGETLDFGGSAQVVAVPGHTEGSIAVYLPRDRVLLTGDAIAETEGRVILGVFNQDRARTVASFRRLAALDVDVACFGHGEPLLSDAGKRLREAAEGLA